MQRKSTKQDRHQAGKDVNAKQERVNIRIVSSNVAHESNAGHQVRTLTERFLCDWLTGQGIAHQHSSDVFIVRSVANGSPELFAPDIILNKKTRDGKSIIIEALHSFSPKQGGLKALVAFRKQYGEQYHVIAVGKNLAAYPRTVADYRYELDQLNSLSRRLEKLLS